MLAKTVLAAQNVARERQVLLSTFGALRIKRACQVRQHRIRSNSCCSVTSLTLTLLPGTAEQMFCTSMVALTRFIGLKSTYCLKALPLNSPLHKLLIC